MDLQECFRKGMIKKTRKDEDLIDSLVEMAYINEATVNSAKINSFSISAYVSLAYDSLRQILEAICISKGYKVLSHVCIAELMKELFIDFDYQEFDRLRYIRNSINYYGTKVELKQGKEIIKKIFRMKNLFLKKYLNHEEE
ncbi:MAG: hypothetical protein PWQ28_683 [Candidatus Woesearchaeota archaeon]|nr:hypothetical protein [Candidatus Woesearchaeota archaeon]